MNELIIIIAKYLIGASVLIWIIYWWRLESANKRPFAVQTVIAGALAMILAKIAGALYYNPRPFVVEHITPLIKHAADNGFPSDHTLLAALLGFVVLTKNRHVGSALLAIALLIGSARVAASVHHPLDIVASFVVAALAVGLVRAGEHLWSKRAAHTSVEEL